MENPVGVSTACIAGDCFLSQPVGTLRKNKNPVSPL